MPSQIRLHQDKLLEQPWYQEMLENRRRAAEEEERARRRDLIIYSISFLFWPLLGALICMWGMHTPRVEYSRAIMEAGIVLGNAGVIVTLMVAYKRSR